MTDHLDDILMTSETWSDYQALQLIERQFNAALAELSQQQRQRYLQLCRIEPRARHEMAGAIQDFNSDFEDTAYRELVEALRRKSGQTLDLHSTWLHTRMTELPESKQAKDPVELLSNLFSSRTRRALHDLAPREHVMSRTLWQAAKDNFAFNLGSTQLHSGLDFQRASLINTSAHINHSGPLVGLDVAGFVEVIRQFDFAARLRTALALPLASAINPLIFAHRKASFELDVLEAIRSKTITVDSNRLMQALVSEKGVKWTFIQMQFGISLPGRADTIALPFCVMKVPDSPGVFSYFPNRPEGALRTHADPAQAITSLRQQIRADARANNIQWLLRALSLADQATLLAELKDTAPDQSKLNWLAKLLYRAFGTKGSPASQIHLRAETDSPRPAPHSLLNAMEMRQSRIVAMDLQSIATTTASSDWEQIKSVLLRIGSEILELLTLPAPGGVTGLNRLMLTATLGTLAYNTVSASASLARGQSAEFVQALGDIADLLISGRTQMIGARLSARRTRQLINDIGKPWPTEQPDGDSGLWLADLSTYTQMDPKTLKGLTANAQGLYEKNGKTYARIQVDDQIRIGEVTLDADFQQYRLQHPDPQRYQPLLSRDISRHHWHLAAPDVSALTRVELLQTLLRPDMPTLSNQDIEHILSLTRIEYSQLEAIWQGRARTPWALELAIRDLQLRHGLDLLLQALEQPGQPMPVWPDFYDHVLPLLNRHLSATEPGTPDWRRQAANLLRNNQSNAHAALLARHESPATLPLRQRFRHLPEAAARELLHRYPALATIDRRTPLDAEQLSVILDAQTRGRLISAINTLRDPSGRGLNADSEAIALNLITALGNWPDDLCIQVYQGGLNFSGHIVKFDKLLATYGEETAVNSVILARFNDRHAGYDQTNDDMLQPQATPYPLTSMLLHTLTDSQRDAFKYGIHDGTRLAQAMLSETQIHSDLLPDLLPVPTTFELSAQRLGAFEVKQDFSTSTADSAGLHHHDGKLYAEIASRFFQVLHDLDASSPSRQIMRIVKPDDPVSRDARNIYVASRPGRSEPVIRDERGLWVGTIIGLPGSGAKLDRRKELLDKRVLDHIHYVDHLNRFVDATHEFKTLFKQPSIYFLLAGQGYVLLKKATHQDLMVQIRRHRKIAATDFKSLPPTTAQKHETLTHTLNELEQIAQNYNHIRDVYKGVSDLELETLEETGLSLEGAQKHLPPFNQMQEDNARVISILDTFKSLAHSEMERLLAKLDDFPPVPQAQTRSRPSPGKKKKKTEKPSVSTPAPAITPKNRVEIRTEDDRVLSGKPRNDNPHIVDILDSRGQRKATYLLSSDGQYWVQYTPTQASSPSTSTEPASGPTWATFDDAVQKLLGEVRHSESVADYLGRKPDSTPSAPEGLLEYQANRLEEQAQEIQDALPQLESEDRRQAQDTTTELRDKARVLRLKGRNLRVDLIISNNTPTANDLQYLADTDNLYIRQTREERLPMERAGTSRQQAPRDYIDEFELTIKDRDQVWAYAHLHYAEPASEALAFHAAHLKRPAQRFQGAQVQIQEAQAGHRYEIHRGTLHKAQVQDILLAQRFGQRHVEATLQLSPQRLAAFRVDMDFSASTADASGLHQRDGRLYIDIENVFYQVLHDLDASSPSSQVMRIVRPGDPVAADARNIYVASRPGRSEPVVRDSQGGWVGVVTGLSGGAPKTDRLKALREKLEAEEAQVNAIVSGFIDAAVGFRNHAANPAAGFYFRDAGMDYFQLKRTNHHHLEVQIQRHNKIMVTDFKSLPPTTAQKRDVLTQAIRKMDKVAQNYNTIIDVYLSTSDLETDALMKAPMTSSLKREEAKFIAMLEATRDVVLITNRFKSLAHDEIDRLLIKLDEFPELEKPPASSKPLPAKKKNKPEQSSSRIPRPAVALPRNRVDIRTDQDKVISGKPRSDNPHIVDILDSRGQRKATYLRSSDGQYWVEYTPARNPDNAPAAATGPVWADYDVATQKVLDEARHSESVADYLGRKKDSTPSGPQDLLEYQANRLDEQAREIEDVLTQLTSDADRQQAQARTTEIREKARTLRQKGRTLRIDLIISNNRPTANDLQYLADIDNLQVRKPHAERIVMERAGSSTQQPARDYIDEFELTIKDRDHIWAYAHLHYADRTTDALNFGAAHLKRPEQRFQGTQLQILEAQAGRRYEIHRGALHKPQVQDILLSGHFE